MKLPISFFPQQSENSCGPAALRMVLAYFEGSTDAGLEKIEAIIGDTESRGVLTIQLAIAAASLGFRARLFTKHLLPNPENAGLDFYQKYKDLIARTEEFILEAKRLEVQLEEKSLKLDELLGLLTKKSIPIVLLDWNVVTNKVEKRYQGHFVPLVGFDDENVIVHNQGMQNPRAFLEIKKEVFEKARKAKGTDEDVLVVGKR